MFLLSIIVTRSGPPVPWLWPVAGACAGVYLFYRGFCLLQRKRLIMNTPSSKIRSAAMGLVEVSGLATGPYTLSAPITGLPCYFYRTMVWQWKQRGKSSGWVKEADESLHVPFYLEDNTGRLLVNPQGAEMEIHRDFHDEFSSSVFSSSLDIPSNISNFLQMHGISTDKRIKVEEYCIKPKNALFVLGTLATNPGLSVSAVPVRTVSPTEKTVSLNLGGLPFGSNLQSSGETALDNLSANSGPERTQHPTLDPEQQAKMAAVLSKAGITSAAAWAAAGISRPTPVVTTGGGGVATSAPALEQFDLHPPTVLTKGTHDPAFFISWRSQREVVQSLGWKSALMIWGGPVLTLFCVHILAAGFGWW